MPAILELLGAIFKTARSWNLRAFEGLLQAEERSLAVSVVRRLNFKVGNVHISYSNLHKADQAAVDVATKLACRFTHEYVNHHDDDTGYRIDASSLDSFLQSHRTKLLESARNAVVSEFQSAGYDAIYGKPMFLEEKYLKQLASVSLSELHDLMK